MNQSRSLVSIGIPTYNRPTELRRTLEGIVGQTYTNLEIIISDNASPSDSTEEVVREFMRGDSRIKYFRQVENLGALSNFQFVLDKAVGDFFMWAADDDYRAPTFIEVLVDLLQRHPESAIAFCDFMEVDEHGVKAEGYPHHLPLLRPFSSENFQIRILRFFLQLELKGKANLIYGLVRRESLSQFDWNKFVNSHGEYGADMLFVFSILCKGKLSLSDQLLYRCTVGNKKEYVVALPLSWKDKFAVPFVGLAKQLIYSVQYLFIATGWARVFLVVIWLIKVIDILGRIFLATEIRNLYRRIRREFSTCERS